MNRETIKEISNWAMIIGGSVFALGFSSGCICRSIDRKEAKTIQNKIDQEAQTKHASEMRELNKQKLEAELIEKNLYSEKLKSMDQKEFAKHHAEQTAKANDDVIAQANQIKLDANSQVAKAQMECKDEIAKIRKDCLEKIEAANKERDTAIEKYEQIDALFTNRREILKAKAELEELANKNAQAKANMESLVKSLKDTH